MVDIYQIQVKGHLDSRWSDWFNDMQLTCHKDGMTDIVGPVIDQAALFGLLLKIHDLNLPLVSVSRIEPGQSNHSCMQ